MISILIVEFQNKIQSVLKSYLEQEGDFEILGSAANSQVALEKIEQFSPDVVVLDIETLGIDGLNLTQVISECFVKTKVLILSLDRDRKYLKKALRAGAKGYLPKTASLKEIVDAIRSIHEGYLQLELGLIDKLNSKSSSVANNSGQNLEWRRYLGLGVLLNAAVWGLVFLYLKATPPKYTSQWGVKILETDRGVDVSLPELGRTSPGPGSGRASQDPRTDYVYIATDPAVLEKAAKQVGISPEDFDEPEITIDEDSGIIDFAIMGTSPSEAQQKAYALHQAMNQKIEQLRKTELERQEQQTQKILEGASQKLDAAQKKLSSYQASSPLSSEEQIKNLVENIEELRRQQAELLAQERGLSNRFKQLSRDLRIFSPEPNDAYRLLGDNLYNKHLEEYAQAKTTLTNLLSRFTSQHPQTIDKQAELEEITAALQERASFLLGRSVTPQEQMRIAYLALDPKTKIAQKELFQDLIINRADQQRLEAHNQKLKQQIAELERHLKRISQEKFTVDSLQHNLQVAETIFASTLAKLDLSKDNIYSIYPPVQLVIEPSLPDTDETTTPSTGYALLGGCGASFLVITGLILLWSEQKQSWFNRPIVQEKSLSLPKINSLGAIDR